MVKPISITGGTPTNLPPLLFVMAISAAKDWFEDMKRSNSDKQENNSKCERLSFKSKSLETVAWKDVRVGDIVKVSKNQFFCADMVTLITSEPSTKTICYVETKNLDGETNLKHKVAPKELVEKIDLFD